MRELANERRRFGYRRPAILLKREGKGMNLKKVSTGCITRSG
jgi:putative transposase